ncbi:MAG: hypothetical protein N3A66_03580, partial [Planctomycetota bacterium]|nr:hypothetical protein [Planctomycetota bacterium]
MGGEQFACVFLMCHKCKKRYFWLRQTTVGMAKARRFLAAAYPGPFPMQGGMGREKANEQIDFLRKFASQANGRAVVKASAQQLEGSKRPRGEAGSGETRQKGKGKKANVDAPVLSVFIFFCFSSCSLCLCGESLSSVLLRVLRVSAVNLSSNFAFLRAFAVIFLLCVSLCPPCLCGE